MPILGVVVVTFSSVAARGPQVRAETGSEKPPAARPTARTSSADLRALASPLLSGAKVSRLAVLAGGGQATSVGEPGKLVYSNTRGTLAFGPSGEGGIRIADDIVTTALRGCSLDRYVIRVTGDNDGTGDNRPYAVTAALYDGCPGAVTGSTPIDGTQCVGEFADGGIHDMVCTVPELITVPIPSTLYLAVTFDRGNAGWIVGAPAAIGYSVDRFNITSFCAADFGGFPNDLHASFYAEIFVRSCGNAFPTYRNTNQSGPAFTRGRFKRFADDITLTQRDCKIVGYEVSVKGSCPDCSGTLWVALKTSLRDTDPEAALRGTSAMTFVSTDKVRVFRVPEEGHFDPPIPLNQTNLFIAFMTDSDDVGPIVTGIRAGLGATTDTYAVYQGTAPTGEWVLRDFVGDHLWSAFDVTVLCDGDPPVGACCDMLSSDETGEGVCRELPEMNCPANRWHQFGVCDPAPFFPACGLGACCKPDDTCENLTLSECNAVPPVDRARLWRPLELCDPSGSTCPFNACVDLPGDCRLARSSPGCVDPFCCTDVCEFDSYCCSVEWDRICLRWADEFCDSVRASNDSCYAGQDGRGGSGRLAVDSNQTVVIGNRGAVNNSGEPGFCCGNETPGATGFQTLWFEFEAVETSTRISTCGTDPPVADTLIQVFRVIDDSSPETACESVDAIACNDDADECSTGTLSSVCATDLVVGETYIVKVGTKSPDDTGVLQVDFRSPCTPAVVVTNDECRLAEPIVAGTTAFDLTGASFDCPGPACLEAMVNDLWYEWTASATGHATISSCGVGGASAETTLAVYEGCACPVDESNVSCGESQPDLCLGGSRVQFPASKGVCYKVRVGSLLGGATSGDLSVKLNTCPVGPVLFMVPLSGVIDARQPRTFPGAGALDTFSVSAPVGADDPACWTLCQMSAGESSSAIASIGHSLDDSLLISLDRPVVPGSSISLIYTDRNGVATTGTFTVHPGNVNADAVTDARDVGALIAILQGQVPPRWNLFSADVDRSGSLAPGDLLRLIDLLNGSDMFAPGWNGTPRPENPGSCPN